MQHRRIEIDGVFRLEHEIFSTDFDGQRAFDHVEKLDTRVLVRPELSDRNLLKISQKGAQFALGGAVIEAFEVVLHIRRAWPLGKAHALLLSNHPNDPALAFVGRIAASWR